VNHTISDNKSTLLGLELISKAVSELNRQVGMEADDKKRTHFLKELCDLLQLRLRLESAKDQLIGKRMDELADELKLLERGDSRRARIVREIIWVRKMLKVI
jgi:hypothetical protein